MQAGLPSTTMSTGGPAYPRSSRLILLDNIVGPYVRTVIAPL
jgi:hypothetical protein